MISPVPCVSACRTIPSTSSLVSLSTKRNMTCLSSSTLMEPLPSSSNSEIINSYNTIFHCLRKLSFCFIKKKISSLSTSLNILKCWKQAKTSCHHKLLLHHISWCLIIYNSKHVVPQCLYLVK